MSKETGGDQQRYTDRLFQKWIGGGKISDRSALRLSGFSTLMMIPQMIILIFCFLYLAYWTQLEMIQTRTPFILIAPMLIFLCVCFWKAKKIQDSSALGNAEEVKRSYRQGIIYMWAFFMIFLIMTFAVLYYLLR